MVTYAMTLGSKKGAPPKTAGRLRRGGLVCGSDAAKGLLLCALSEFLAQVQAERAVGGSGDAVGVAIADDGA